jgi:hypothetical protein
VATFILRTLVFKITKSLALRLLVVGLSISVAGSLILVFGAVYINRAIRSKNGAQRPERAREKASFLAGFALIGAGLFIQLLSAFTLTLRR